jgi:hypothetical protein
MLTLWLRRVCATAGQFVLEALQNSRGALEFLLSHLSFPSSLARVPTVLLVHTARLFKNLFRLPSRFFESFRQFHCGVERALGSFVHPF